jgi:hypothetical protein
MMKKEKIKSKVVVKVVETMDTGNEEEDCIRI